LLSNERVHAEVPLRLDALLELTNCRWRGVDTEGGQEEQIELSETTHRVQQQAHALEYTEDIGAKLEWVVLGQEQDAHDGVWLGQRVTAGSDPAELAATHRRVGT